MEETLKTIIFFCCRLLLNGCVISVVQIGKMRFVAISFLMPLTALQWVEHDFGIHCGYDGEI